MEEQIPLKERLKYMIGPQLDWVKPGTADQRYSFSFGFYWFMIAFFWKWHPHIITECQFTPCPWTGIIFAYKPTCSPEYGDLLWSQTKKWMRGE
jgi:hypothetical protein